MGWKKQPVKKDSKRGKEHGAYKEITRCVSAAGAERAGGTVQGVDGETGGETLQDLAALLEARSRDHISEGLRPDLEGSGG